MIFLKKLGDPMEEMSIERQQNRVLVEAIRKVVTNPRTPGWVKRPLTEAVKEAKALKPSEPTAVQRATAVQREEPEQLFWPPYVGAECVDALNPKDECLYKILREGIVIDQIQLYDVQVLKGDSKTPPGVIMHNVPSNYLKAVKPELAHQDPHDSHDPLVERLDQPSSSTPQRQA